MLYASLTVPSIPLLEEIEIRWRHQGPKTGLRDKYASGERKDRKGPISTSLDLFP